MSDLVKLLRESFVAYSPKERKVRSFRVREDIMPGDRERIADELERLEQENADLRTKLKAANDKITFELGNEIQDLHAKLEAKNKQFNSLEDNSVKTIIKLQDELKRGERDEARAELVSAKKVIAGLNQTIERQHKTNTVLISRLHSEERVNKLHGEMLDEYQKVLIPNYSMTNDRFKKEADNLRGQLKTELKNKEYLQGWCDYLVKRLQAVFDTISEYPLKEHLKEIEWTETDNNGYLYCKICGGFEPYWYGMIEQEVGKESLSYYHKGHKPDCWLHRAIKKNS
jgi:hypothetical protein